LVPQYAHFQETTASVVATTTSRNISRIINTSFKHENDFMKKLLMASALCMPPALPSNYSNFIEQTWTCRTPHYSAGQLLDLGKKALGDRELDKAFEHFSRALDLEPTEHALKMELGNNILALGNIFFEMHASEKAIACFSSIFRLFDGVSAAHHNIAFTYAEQLGDNSKAIEHYQKALAIRPDNTETHFCLSLAYLASGDLIHGFKEYETRWLRHDRSPKAIGSYPFPQQWQGQALAGKRIYLNVEQGLGDTLQFIRYAQMLKQQGATVIAEVQKPLIDILALCSYIDELVAHGTPAPQFDYQVPLLNLPLMFKTTIQTIPSQVPYLRANPLLIQMWHGILATDKNLKVGVCWRGDSAHGPHKFMPRNYFEQLAAIPGVSVYSLQKNEPLQNSEIKQFSSEFDETNGRFMDTAAVMKNLDLVITVDTSIAHLAGGLGVPVWVVLPFPAEWRWLTERSDSPWYPTMRLFRQKRFGDWNSTIDELTTALKQRVLNQHG
jgi:tetratricopeptide (TPR) repeat protein